MVVVLGALVDQACMTVTPAPCPSFIRRSVCASRIVVPTALPVQRRPEGPSPPPFHPMPLHPTSPANRRRGPLGPNLTREVESLGGSMVEWGHGPRQGPGTVHKAEVR